MSQKSSSPSSMQPGALPLLLSLLALPADLADAVRIGISGQRRTPAAHGLHRRATLNGTTGLNDGSGVTYTTNITLGGNEFSVIIDTGRCVCHVHDIAARVLY